MALILVMLHENVKMSLSLLGLSAGPRGLGSTVGAMYPHTPSRTCGEVGKPVLSRCSPPTARRKGGRGASGRRVLCSSLCPVEDGGLRPHTKSSERALKGAPRASRTCGVWGTQKHTSYPPRENPGAAEHGECSGTRCGRGERNQADVLGAQGYPEGEVGPQASSKEEGGLACAQTAARRGVVGGVGSLQRPCQSAHEGKTQRMCGFLPLRGTSTYDRRFLFPILLALWTPPGILRNSTPGVGETPHAAGSKLARGE